MQRLMVLCFLVCACGGKTGLDLYADSSAMPVDAVTADARVMDAAMTDAATQDAHQIDATTADARVTDAAMHDAAAVDACALDDCSVVPLPPVEQQAYLRPVNPSSYDFFGNAVAIDGDTIVIGASNEDSGATGIDGDEANDSAQDSGAAFVFVRAGSTWTQQAYLKASNADAGDGFGSSVAISGNTIVVGTPTEASEDNRINGDQADNSAANVGAVYVFVREGGAWRQQAYLKASNSDAGDYFGCSVAIVGDTLAVGAWGEASLATGVNGTQGNESGQYPGAAYVFVRAGEVWSQEAYVKATDRLASQFGMSVALHGERLLVGAPYPGNEPDSAIGGAAYTFVRNGAVWTPETRLMANHTDHGDMLGWSVSLSESAVVVGASMEASAATGVNGNPSDNSVWRSGAAYVFADDGMRWRQRAYLKATETASTEFAHSVAASGNVVVVGGPADDGVVQLFVRAGDAWVSGRTLRGASVERADYFGYSVAISGNTVVVGAPGESSIATGGLDLDNARSGAVYVFELP